MSGVVAAMAGAGPLKYVVVVDTDGVTGTGFRNGGGTPAVAYGASSITPATAGGFTIDSLYDEDDGLGTTAAVFEVEGNHTGTWWTSITFNGSTFSRASFSTPTGSYDGGTNSTKWRYPGHVWGFYSGSYEGTIT